MAQSQANHLSNTKYQLKASILYSEVENLSPSIVTQISIIMLTYVLYTLLVKATRPVCIHIPAPRSYIPVLIFLVETDRSCIYIHVANYKEWFPSACIKYLLPPRTMITSPLVLHHAQKTRMNDPNNCSL